MLNTNLNEINSLNLREMFGAFCVDLFRNKSFIENKKTDTDYKTLHKSVCSLIKIALETEKSISIDRDAKDVIYMMSVIADEVFLNTAWEGKQYWEENMLEQRFFGSQIAGEEVFNKINELIIENEPLSTEKAEIYLKVLSLGFLGKYRGTDDEKSAVDSYRNRLFEFIEKNNKSMFLIGHRLFQREYTFTIPTIHRKLLPDAAIVNYICAFFIFMFLAISSVVWIFETREFRQLLLEISSIALRE